MIRALRGSATALLGILPFSLPLLLKLGTNSSKVLHILVFRGTCLIPNFNTLLTCDCPPTRKLLVNVNSLRMGNYYVDTEGKCFLGPEAFTEALSPK